MAGRRGVAFVRDDGFAGFVEWEAASLCGMVVHAFEDEDAAGDAGAGDAGAGDAGAGAADADRAGGPAAAGRAGRAPWVYDPHGRRDVPGVAAPRRLPVPLIAAEDLNPVLSVVEEFAELPAAPRAVGAAAASLAPGAGRRGDRARLAAFCADIRGVPARIFRGVSTSRLFAVIRGLDYLQADAPLALLLISRRDYLADLASSVDGVGPVAEILAARLPAVRTLDTGLAGDVPAVLRGELADLPALCVDGVLAGGDEDAPAVEGVSLVGSGSRCRGLLKSRLFTDLVRAAPPIRRLCIELRGGEHLPSALVAAAPHLFEDIVISTEVNGVDYFRSDMEFVGGKTQILMELVRAAIDRAGSSLTLAVTDKGVSRDRLFGYRGRDPQPVDVGRGLLGFIVWAVRAVAAQRGDGPGRGAPLALNIDLVPAYFVLPGFVDQIRDTLRESGVAGRLRALAPGSHRKSDLLAVSDFEPGVWDSLAAPEDWADGHDPPPPPPFSVPVVFYGRYGDPLWEFVPPPPGGGAP